jgi:hypothetical protein
MNTGQNRVGGMVSIVSRKNKGGKKKGRNEK